VSGRNGQVVGYARVSAADQKEARQIAALGEVDRMFVDKASGRNTHRPELEAMLRYVRDGDTIRVKSPDRLARSTTDLLSLVGRLANEHVAVQDTRVLRRDRAENISQPGRHRSPTLARVRPYRRGSNGRGFGQQAPGPATTVLFMAYSWQPAERMAAAHMRSPGFPVARVLGCSGAPIQVL